MRAPPDGHFRDGLSELAVLGENLPAAGVLPTLHPKRVRMMGETGNQGGVGLGFLKVESGYLSLSEELVLG